MCHLSQSLVQVQPGVDIIRTNLEFLQEQFNSIAAHVMHCTGQGLAEPGRGGTLDVRGCQVSVICPSLLPTDSGFGARLLELCNQGLFECLALNLHCLGGQQMELAAVINGRIVSITQPQIPSLLLFLRFSLVSCSFFFLQTATLYALAPFKSQLKVLYRVCTLPHSVACLVE